MNPVEVLKLIAYLRRRCAWTNLSAAALVAVLQRAPALRVAAAADEFAATSPVGSLLRSAALMAASLGAIDSMAGATLLATTLTPDPTGGLPVFDAAVGVPITPLGFTIANLVTIGSWAVTGMIPPGLTLTTAQPNGGSLTGSGGGFLDATSSSNTLTTPLLEGTPTTPGTYTFNLKGYWYGGESGGPYGNKGISSVFPFTVVVAEVAPVFTTQPVSVTVTGGTVALNAVASNASSYQWIWNGTTPVAGAMSPILLLSNAAASVGSYTCIAANAVGNATSDTATVSVAATNDPGRMVNLSARSQVGTGADIIFAGFAIGGVGTSGSQSVLIRASGPAIAAAPFNVPGTLPDPQLDLFDAVGDAIPGDLNDGWGGTTTITATAAAVGAFAWSNPSSHDAALDLSLPAGPYTAQVSGQNGDTGVSLVEVYDATPSGTYTLATPRLVNLSARVDIHSGAANALFAGFVIHGSTALTVLIRASGPAIAAAPFNVAGTLPDPQLTLENQSNGAVIMSNSSWGGDAHIVSTAASVGAFGWSNASSHDSALLITLPPGNYSAVAAGSTGDAGVAIVEVYEVK